VHVFGTFSSFKFGVFLDFITLNYVACFLILSFDSLSVLCRLHNLWSLSKILFLVSSAQGTRIFTDTICSFHVMPLTCHIKGCMYLLMYQNSKIVPVYVEFIYILLKLVLWGVDGILQIATTVHEQTEPATFSILMCLASFRNCRFLYSIALFLYISVTLHL
jgi:hypothetical protein